MSMKIKFSVRKCDTWCECCDGIRWQWLCLFSLSPILKYLSLVSRRKASTFFFLLFVGTSSVPEVSMYLPWHIHTHLQLTQKRNKNERATDCRRIIKWKDLPRRRVYGDEWNWNAGNFSKFYSHARSPRMVGQLHSSRFGVHSWVSLRSDSDLLLSLSFIVSDI